MWRAYETSHTEHQSETDEPEEDGAEHKVNQILHQYVGGILGADKSSFHQSESRLHEEYQHGCQQHPYSIQTGYNSLMASVSVLLTGFPIVRLVPKGWLGTEIKV